MADGDQPTTYDPSTQPALDVGGQVHPLILQAIRDRLVGAASAAIQPFKPAVQEAANIIGYPGQVFQAGMAGQTPSPAEMVPWATGTAMGMIGGGSPFAQAGALGSAGGKALAAAPVAEEAAAPAGIRAYHSSPYDFGSFDINKIGSGQGAQAYGHGLYFAENPKVSGQGGEYWEEFSHQFKGPEGMAMRQLQAANFDRAKAIEASGKNLADNRAFLAQDIAEQYPNLTATNARKYLDNLTADRQAAHDLLVSGQPVGPRTYEVNIRAQPEHFIDYDKPLSEQSPPVQAVAAKLWPEGVPTTNKYGEVLKGRDLYDYAVQRAGGVMFKPELERAGITGPAPGGTHELTGKYLASQGVPGIKYLDQGSRVSPRQLGQAREDVKYLQQKFDQFNDPNPRQYTSAWHAQNRLNEAQNRLNELQTRPETSNFVVFNDKLIDIAKKYGLAGLIAGGAYHAQMPAPQAAEADYDYAGAKSAGAQPDARGHLPDTYKLPNHITFSDESKYHTQEQPGGHWQQDQNNTWHFTPSAFNLRQHSAAEMRDYFRQHEPGAILHLPGQ